MTALVGLGAVVGQAGAATPGSITGTVTTTTGVPLAGVEVSVETRTIVGGAETWVDVQATRARTDAAGRYTISVPPTVAGAEGYVVGFHAAGFASRYHADQRNRDTATRLVVAEGQQRAGINARLPRVGSVGGTVTNTRGEPIRGATVTALELAVSATGLRTWQAVSGGSAQTNASGVYRLEAPAGRYRIMVGAPGGFETRFFPTATDVDEGEYVEVAAGEVTSPIDMVLPKLARVQGSLVEPDGRLTADDAVVELWREVTLPDDDEYQLDDLPNTTWRLFGSDQVSNGTFTVDLPAGTYRVKVLLEDGSVGFMPGFVGLHAAPDLVVGQEKTVRAGSYVLPAQSVVSGRVSDTWGNALRGYTVRRLQDQVEQINDGVPVQPVQLPSWRVNSTTTTGADGRWSMRVRHGSYRFGVSGQYDDDHVTQWFDRVSDFRDSTDVVVDRAIPDVDFLFGPTAVQKVRDPWISGHNKPGGTLTAHLGQWSPSNATLTVRWYADGQLIEGVTGTTYTVPSSPLGPLLGDGAPAHHVVVTASAPGRPGATATSLATKPFSTGLLGAGNPPLENRALPQVVGTPRVGVPLTSTTGEWSVAPGATTRQWLVDGIPVTGATGASYTPTAADAGKTVQVRVTEASGITVTSRASEPVGRGEIAPVSAPRITGTAQVGRALTADPGTWSVAGTTHTFQWYLDGVPVPGATGAEFTPGVGSEGSRASVAVTANAPGHLPATARSAVSAPIKPAQLLPDEAPLLTNTVAPVISGTPEVGARLTATSGTWTPTPRDHSYQWLRDGQPIAGATGSEYELVVADAGTEVTVRVTARLSGHQDTSTTAAPVQVAAVDGTLAAGTPRVLGRARVGNVLILAPGEHAPAAATVRREWLRNGTVVPGRTGTTYAVTKADLGATLSVRLTYTLGEQTLARQSVATTRVTTSSKVKLKIRDKGATAVVTVKAHKVGKATGAVQVVVQGTGKQFTSTLANGRAVVTLKGFPRGKYKVVARYLGSEWVAVGKTSKRATVG